MTRPASGHPMTGSAPGQAMIVSAAGHPMTRSASGEAMTGSPRGASQAQIFFTEQVSDYSLL